MSVSYYRKYRPQTVSQIDLLSVRQVLERILKSGTFSHAYLFYGPKGTGKTSSARILAKILNCDRNRQSLTKVLSAGNGQPTALEEPCGECEGCLSVQKGNNLSVIEMDAASNRGIDDIRTLRERVGLAPASGLFTVYVIDEVHMLTTEAFNALLKTLEEPPAQAVFVMCTTESHKVPETVISRCQTVVFSQASEAEIKQSLKKAIEGEKLTVSDSDLDSIAKAAKGSFRDGMKLLEQAAQIDQIISQDEVRLAVSQGGMYETEALWARILERDAAGILTLIKNKEAQGIDMYEWGERLIILIREQLYQAVVAPETGTAISAEVCASILKTLQPAVIQIKQAPVPAVPLETSLIEWCLENKGKGEVKSEKGKSQPEVKTEALKQDHEVKGKAQVKTNINLEMVKTAWTEVMREVKPHNHSLEALLRSARPVSLEGDWLAIEVFYTFHKEQLEQERHRRIVEETLAKVLSSPVKVKYTLGKRTAKAMKQEDSQVKNVTGQVDDEDLAEAAEAIFS